MDTLLMTVTVLSLAMALGMAFVVMTLLRDERARAAARIAVLTAMAAEPPASGQRFWPDDNSPVARMIPPAAPVPPARPQQLDDVEIRPEAGEGAGAPQLFAHLRQGGSPAEPSVWGRRLAVIGGLASMIAIVGFALASGSVRQPAAAPPSTAARTAPEADIPPLELLALRHSREPHSLTISGIVEKPRGGDPLTGVIATAFVFGPDGAFLTSGRAPIDSTTLAPGDQSAFAVTVPVNGEVSRYRIGFRAPDGRVIAHVDKRTDTLASRQERP